MYIRDPLFSQSRQDREIREIKGARTIRVLQYLHQCTEKNYFLCESGWGAAVRNEKVDFSINGSRLTFFSVRFEFQNVFDRNLL